MQANASAYKKIKEGFIGQKMIIIPPDVKKLVTKNDLTKRLHITTIGYYPHAIHHDRERVAGCPQYILLHCIKGKGHIELQGKHIELSANTCFIIPKNVPHHYKSSTEEPWSIYWAHFTGDHADALYYRYQEKKTDPQPIPYDERRIDAFEEVFNLLESSFEIRDLEIINIKFQHYISSFIYFKETEPAPNGYNEINNSIAYMKANIGSQLFIEDLAMQQHLSVSHYCRLFRAKTGTSPNHYFNQLKIQKSCQYLYFSDRNIKEISAELGFDDPFYFSRLFKKLMGISPANYKNQHKR